MMYLHLSSADSKLLFPDNTSYDFIVELKKPLSGQFLIALAEFQCSNLSEPLLLFCDIVSPSLIKNQELPILRVIEKTGEPRHLHYFSVSRTDVQRITVTIRDAKMKIPDLAIGDVTCTLHLKPI